MEEGPLTASKDINSPGSVVESDDDEEESGRRNPFRLPADSNIFLLRKQERERKKTEQQQKLKMKVHERGVYATRKKARQAELWCELRAGHREDAANQEAVELKDNLSWKVAMIKDRNVEKESIGEFISKKREMFLLEYALVVKQDEMDQLDKMAAAEDKKLARAEKLLDKDAVMFDEFLKESDKSAVEAIKIAEQESKIKQEKVSEIKRITAKMVAIKSDISKYEDTLKEYSMYKDFLFKLSPLEWQQEQLARRKSAQKTLPTIAEKDKAKTAGQQEKRSESRASISRKELPPLRIRRASKAIIRAGHLTGSRTGTRSPKPSVEPKTEDVSLSDYEEEPAMYFTDPQQLLDLLTDLEEQNLSLIQNSRETEEALEELRLVLGQTRKRMEKETEQLRQQIESMSLNIKLEEERAGQLEIKARLFSYGQYKEDDQDSMLDCLGHKVEEVYRSCVGDSEGNLSTLQMLTAIESRVGELLENVEAIPREHVLMAEKTKERERRVRMREEKIIQQKKHQEERIRKALERAQADITKAKGKKLMVRSCPPERRKKETLNTDITDREREEHLYFFT